jgi:hypothetical protein
VYFVGRETRLDDFVVIAPIPTASVEWVPFAAAAEAAAEAAAKSLSGEGVVEEGLSSCPVLSSSTTPAKSEWLELVRSGLLSLTR